MKVYVLHYDKLTDRRERLEKILKEKGLDKDCEWIIEYPKEHPLIQKIIDITGTRIPRGYISTNMKHYEAMYRMIRDDVKEAIIFEDDVIFSEYWDISKIPREFPYVKLGKGVPDMGIPSGDKPLCIGNNGGAEAYYVKRLFARDFLENIDVCWGIEIEQHAYMLQSGIPLICVPMCTQDFGTTSVTEPKDYGMTWIQYIQEYYPKSKKLSFKLLVQSNDAN